MTEEEWERRAFENEITAAKRGMVHVIYSRSRTTSQLGSDSCTTFHLAARTGQLVIMGFGTGWRRTR
jgi:hypothetical protein